MPEFRVSFCRCDGLVVDLKDVRIKEQYVVIVPDEKVRKTEVFELNAFCVKECDDPCRALCDVHQPVEWKRRALIQEETFSQPMGHGAEDAIMEKHIDWLCQCRMFSPSSKKRV